MQNIQSIDNSPTQETGNQGTTGVGKSFLDSQLPYDSSIKGSSSPEFSIFNSPYLKTENEATISKSELILYLIPVLGFFPSLWTVYRRQGNREQLAVARLSITLAFTWLLGYLLFLTGAGTSEFFALRLLILNSFFTSGYFLVSLWLIFRLMQGKSKRLPGFSHFADRIFSKYLS